MSPSRRLLAYVGRYRGAFIFGFVCIVATTAISLAGPWVLKYAIDDLTQTGVTAAKLRLYGGAILGLAAVGGVFRFFQRRIIIGASRDIEFDLRNDFFARLQRFEPRVLPPQPDRRPDVARDQRSQRRAHDDRPGGDVPVEHGADVHRGHRADAVD